MAENLRFLLDLDNDVHYTESLVTLNSDRYIWYRLRRAGMDRNILFLRDGETGAPVFRVCDDDSRSRLLQFARRWILSNISETKKEYTPQDLNRSMDDLMAHLLKNKDEKITLVPRKTGGVTTVLDLPIHQDTPLRSNRHRISYTGERDALLVELSDVLPPEFYK